MNGETTKNRPCLIAVVGGSGAGKSWLCDELQRQFGKEAGRLSLDDFYRDRSHLEHWRRSRVNFDHPRSVDWELLGCALEGITAGDPVWVPEYDFARHTRRLLRRWQPKPVVLVDGLWLLRWGRIRRFFDFGIYVDCAARLCLARRLARDVEERGRTASSARAQFRGVVRPMHRLYVEPQRRWADLVLRSPAGRVEMAALVERLRAVTARWRDQGGNDDERSGNG